MKKLILLALVIMLVGCVTNIDCIKVQCGSGECGHACSSSGIPFREHLELCESCCGFDFSDDENETKKVEKE